MMKYEFAAVGFAFAGVIAIMIFICEVARCTICGG